MAFSLPTDAVDFTNARPAISLGAFVADYFKNELAATTSFIPAQKIRIAIGL
jgi:hypothetical protein